MMFKLIWNNNRSEKDRQEADAARSFAPDGEQLKMLAEHFAIGRKIRYFPEYQRDIVFQTIILAYRVNDHFVYSRDAIRKDAEGMPTAFAVEGLKAPLRIEQLRKLQLMVPDTSDMERSLDYVRRANLGRNGQFVRGNAITLIAETCNRGIPSLDTQVDSRIKMKDGPYLDNQMVLLRPDFDTLRIADQRQKARVQSNVPVNLYLADDQPPIPCVLADFSDVSLRLKPAAGQQTLPAIRANDKVVVVLNLGDAISSYRLKGTVFRAAPDACVIRMKQLYKDGEFYAIKTMDVLEIKTGLLNRR
jgi:hypothetical protein